jgi:hypothetical protein
MPGITFLGSNPLVPLEKAIRPFVEDPPKARQGRQDPAQDPNTPVLEWSCTTNVESTTIEALGFKLDEVNEQTETSRSTETRRVFNPSDSSQFVDVERIKTLDTRGADGKRHRTNYSD